MIGVVAKNETETGSPVKVQDRCMMHVRSRPIPVEIRENTARPTTGRQQTNRAGPPTRADYNSGVAGARKKMKIRCFEVYSITLYTQHALVAQTQKKEMALREAARPLPTSDPALSSRFSNPFILSKFSQYMIQ